MVPDGVTEEEIKELISNYLKKKKFEKFYELVEDTDWDELKKEAESFRKPPSSENALVDTSVLVKYSRTKRLEPLGDSSLSTISLIQF